MRFYALMLIAIVAGCSNGASAVGTQPAKSAVAIYPGNGPSTAVPDGERGVAITDLVLTESVSSPGPSVAYPGAQYLIDEPNYSGPFSVTNSCGSGAVASTNFENGIVLGSAGTYSFSPGVMGTGPAALLDVSADGIFSSAACLLEIADSSGNGARITLTNHELLLYPGQTAAQPVVGAMGQAGVLLDNFQPTNYLVFEQGYSGSYTLDPSNCQEFLATLSAGASPGSGAQLSLRFGPSTAHQTCSFVVRDTQGQSATITAYEEE